MSLAPMWDEYRRLLRQRKALHRAIEDLDDEEALLLEEIVQVEGQIAYYTSLTKDMKKALEPHRLGQLLRSLNKG
ncbi:MAG: hypothetical protein ACE5JE_04205 [Thermoplasmata archaeon]